MVLLLFSDIPIIYQSESFYKCWKKLSNITGSCWGLYFLTSQLNFCFSLDVVKGNGGRIAYLNTEFGDQK